MALEIERKYLGVDFDELRRALAEAGAEDLGAHFEANVVMDTPDLSLWTSRRLLRVRSQEWPERTRHVLTLKLPIANPAKGFKAREERELEVESAAVMQGVLAGLGFTESARYEKVRSVWRLAAKDGGAVLVELDELPFCRVVEVEGSPEALEAVARRLGLDKHEISTKSYHALHQEWRSAQGLPPERSFVFGPEERRRLRRQLGLPDGAVACS
ncbi:MULTISPECIES: class IV adenylate cyclase [unclassified Desulfovibrio]|uniref:class IV adenylate cyclase n=1 Tax=unclassified Desulfovibrio TaxID=2593640 RepID=UPI0013EB0C0D|nr:MULTISPECIES: class IV adenylate cyclase [unclassified Desulfovibrio]